MDELLGAQRNLVSKEVYYLAFKRLLFALKGNWYKEFDFMDSDAYLILNKEIKDIYDFKLS